MREERLNELLSDIEDDLLEQAAAIDTPEAFAALSGPKPKTRWARWGALAACLVLVVCAAALVIPRLGPKTELGKAEWETAATGEAEVDIIPRWEEMTIWQQYSQVEYQGRLYFPVGPTEEANAGEVLEAVTARGWDEYEQVEYTLPCQLYTLNSIAPEAGLVVQYEGDGGWYVCRTYDYTSETLGQLIDDLSLEQNLTIGQIHYDYAVDGGRIYETYTLDPQVVWDMLLRDRSLVNAGSEYYTADVISMSVSVEPLGIRNLSLALNEQGYLQTNLIATGASYYIGPERVQAFIDYVAREGELANRRETRFSTDSDSGGEEVSTAPYSPEHIVSYDVSTGETSYHDVPTGSGSGEASTPAYDPNA